MHEMFTSPDVHRALMIRDPIDRFMSGYMDKVLSRKMPENLVKRLRFAATVEDIHIFIDLADEWVSHDHLGLQATHCGLRLYGLRHYNMIFVYHKERMPDVSKAIAEQLNLGHLLTGYGLHRNQSLYGYPTSHAHEHTSSNGPLVTRSKAKEST
eukprot:gene20954-27807_t